MLPHSSNLGDIEAKVKKFWRLHCIRSDRARRYWRAFTTASGRLGEWIELGGSIRNESRSDSGLLLGAASQRKDNRSIWVKVEEIK